MPDAGDAAAAPGSERGQWDGVLVVEIERLARGDTEDQGAVAKAFQYSGTKIVTPLKTYDPGDEFDEEYFEFGLYMSRRELKTINRRLVRGVRPRPNRESMWAVWPPSAMKRRLSPGRRASP